MTTQRQKTAFVTGAASGIGKSLTLELVSRNYKVFANDINVEGLKTLAEAHPDNIIIHKLDVTKLEDIQENYKFVKEELTKIADDGIPKLDLLYNNAGIACIFPLIEVPDDAALQILTINLYAPIRITKIFSDLVINAKGTIAFTGSVTKDVAFPFLGMYTTSKSGLKAYCSTLAFEMEPFDVKVIHVTSGSVRSNIGDKRPWAEDSYYSSTPELKESLEVRKQMFNKTIPMETDAYAKSVISKIENASLSTFNLYEGSSCFILTVMGNWIPRSWMLFILRKQMKLNEAWESLRRKIRSDGTADTKKTK
ncbi:unnamed protein product [Ambrosiozyma monospora]|uniref:Unnamed protein product n=1 Tax=Ambrosiozyma monospora TaxID=43982 RepID=A0ACB5T9S1_AMBMO|nr:unnamed protein product [Ambrosiozyma monospora]